MSISLENSIRTCKVDTGWASRIQSDRFLNSENVLCIPWSGFDNLGRKVCPDSYMTKRPGCNSPADRVVVENDLRPNYISYVTLNAQGIDGTNLYEAQSWDRTKSIRSLNQVTGNFGLDFGSNIAPGCRLYPSQDAQGCDSCGNRYRQVLQHGYASNAFKKAGSCGTY